MKRRTQWSRHRRALLTGLLFAQTPWAIGWGADPQTNGRLPAVAGPSQGAHAGAPLPPATHTTSNAVTGAVAADARTEEPEESVANLFESFKMRRREMDAQASAESRAAAPAATEQRWLRSSTSTASREVAGRLIAQASQEYSVGAWASAETSAWEALRWAAESVELSARERGSVTGASQHAVAKANLQIARTAIREARDFGGQYGVVDGEAIRRMVMSHQTTILDSQPLATLTAADAIDRYLDEARVRLSGIASQSVEAAQAMDLLAAIYLGRADSKTLPSSTALCLRRAALQGQPTNASLAMRLGMHLSDLGLYREARWALEHSLKLNPSQEAADSLVTVLRRSGNGADAARVLAAYGGGSTVAAQRGPRIPTVENLSPQEFASVSKPVMKGPRRNVISGTLASARRNLVHAVRGNPDEKNALSPIETQSGSASASGSASGSAWQRATNWLRSSSGKPTTIPIEDSRAIPASTRAPTAMQPTSDEDEQPSLVRRIFGSFAGPW